MLVLDNLTYINPERFKFSQQDKWVIPWGSANVCLRAGDTNHPHYRVWGKTFNVRPGCLTPWLLMWGLRATARCPDNHNQGLAFKLSQLFVAAPDHLELLPPSSARINLTNFIPRKILMGHSVFPVSDWVKPICPFVLCPPPYMRPRILFSEANPKCTECEMWHMLFPSETGND